MQSRMALAVILFAIVLASCGGAPSVTVTIAGVAVPMALASTSVRTGCSGEVGDAFPREVPLTTVRAPTPAVIHVEAGEGATGTRGWIYDVEAPTASGGPLEEFTVAGRSGDHAAKSIVRERTYTVVVNVMWSSLVPQARSRMSSDYASSRLKRLTEHQGVKSASTSMIVFVRGSM